MVENTTQTITLSLKQEQQNKCSIGVGAIIKKQNQILLVQEANGPVRYHWAFPAGLLQKNETIQQGIQREIQEELNVNSIFKSIFFFGQQPQSRWEKQDLYFGCEVQLLSENITICKKELLDYKWWNLNEVKALELTPITKIGLPFIM